MQEDSHLLLFDRMNPIETSVFLFSPKQNSLETVVILQGLIYFAILPSLLLTVSLIICGNSGSQRKVITILYLNLIFSSLQFNQLTMFTAIIIPFILQLS